MVWLNWLMPPLQVTKHWHAVSFQQEKNNSTKHFKLRDISETIHIEAFAHFGIIHMGLDPALSYALVAREWGQDFFKDAQLGPKLKAAVQKTALGVIDYTAFRSVGNRGNSFSTNEKDSKAHIHQYALNIPLISKKEFGFNLPLDSRYKKLRKLESYSQTSGLIAKCYYSGK